jgi:signal peptidase I
VGLLTGLCLLRAFALDWYEVASGSMAPALLGPHRDLRCAKCGLGYACDALDEPPVGKRALCPNCWSWGPELAAVAPVGGERVLVVRNAWGALAPRRWSVVAFRAPHRAGRVQVKRVLGLPGEQIDLRGGDLYINGRRQRKTLAQQRALAQLVHDAVRDPRPWFGLDLSGYGWRRAQPGFVCWSNGPEHADEVHWLEYRHRQPTGLAGATREAPPEDRCAYNQVRSVEESFPVRDLLLSCRLAWRKRGDLYFRLQAGRHRAIIQVTLPAGELLLEVDGAIVRRMRLHGLTEEVQHWEVSTFDGQILLALDGRTQFCHMLREAAATAGASSRPLALGCRGLHVHVYELRVWRDVYYFWPRAAQQRHHASGGVTLGPDEYFVVGDNVAISDDSRSWPAPGVPARLLIGRPVLVYWRSRSVQILGRQISIPQLSGVRYIY